MQIDNQIIVRVPHLFQGLDLILEGAAQMYRNNLIYQWVILEKRYISSSGGKVDLGIRKGIPERLKHN
jgi:hypothetical protein